MKEYNDYVTMTKRYLKTYNKLEITIENLREEIEAYKNMLLDESVPISRYNERLGGRSELNQTEAAANQRIKIESQIVELEKNKAEIERILRKIDRALEGLDTTSRELVTGYYIDGFSWRQLGQKNYCTEKWARDRGNKALKEIAFMVFGVLARPKQLRFVFVG